MKRKGIKWILIGLLIFLLDIIVVPFGILLPVIKGDPDELIFKAPASEVEFQAQSQGRFYLWNNFETNFNGEAFFVNSKPPANLHVRVTGISGEAVPFHVDTSRMINRLGNSRASLGYVEVEEPTTMKWSATGFEGERILSVSQDHFAKYLLIVILVSVLMMVIALGAAFAVLWGVLHVVCSGIPRAKAWLESDLPLLKKLGNILNNR